MINRASLNRMDREEVKQQLTLIKQDIVINNNSTDNYKKLVKRQIKQKNIKSRCCLVCGRIYTGYLNVCSHNCYIEFRKNKHYEYKLKYDKIREEINGRKGFLERLFNK